MAYPVDVVVEPLLTNRNRLTVAFRLLLALPHIILIGGIGFGVAYRGDRPGLGTAGSESGLLGTVAFVLAVISWFTLVFARTHPAGIRQFTAFYLRWRVRALAYIMLLEDKYPPFGDEPYPAALTLEDAAAPRRRLTIALRILLAIPHFIVLVVLMFAWWITAIVAWLLMLFTARYPQGLYIFAVGCLRWRLRVEAYMLLMVDEYPPFGFV